MFFKLLIAFLLGILSLNFLTLWDISLYVICTIISYSVISFITKRSKWHYNLIFLFVMLGAILASYYGSYESCGLYPLDDKFIEISGYVYDIPVKNNDRYTYIIKTDGAKYKDQVYYVNEYVKLNTDKKLDYAQNVGVKGFLTRISDKMNYSDFDYVSYFKSNGIFYKISDYDIKTDNTKRNSFSLRHLSNIYKNKVSEIVLGLGGDEGALLNAVLTGRRNDFSTEYEDILRKTGTIRMLYPAYLHILLIVSIINFILAFFSKKTKDYVKIIFVIIYALAFSSGFSGIKLGLVIATSTIAIRKYGYLHYPDVLSLVLLILLFFNPLLLYNSGFIISSVMSWVFFMLRPVVYQRLNFIKSFTLRNILTIYIISTLGLLPLGAYFYNAVSIYSGLFNLLYFPLVALIILAFPILVLEFLIFSKSFLIGYLISGAIFIMHKIPYVIDKLPFSHIGLGRPSIITVVMLYLLVIVIKDLHFGHKHFLRTQIISCVVIGGFISSIVLSVLSYGTMSINFVNVGHGDGCYIQLPKRENIIIDGGGGEDYSDYDAGKEIFLPYLKTEGAYRIDLAIVSHCHRDHCLGTIAALKDLDVQAVMMPDFMEDNEYRKEIEALADKKGVEIIYPKDGDKITFESGAEIEIISAGNNYSENDASLIFTVTANGFKTLFTGDSSQYSEYKYIDKFKDVDLLKVAHHGSDTSTSKEFLLKTTPEYALISVGENNSYSLPNNTIIKRLEKSGAQVLRTDELGDIRFQISRNGRMSYKSYYPDTQDWR